MFVEVVEDGLLYVAPGAGLAGAGLRAGAFATGRREGEVRPREAWPREEPREAVFFSGVLRSVSQENRMKVIRNAKIVQEREWEMYFFMRKRGKRPDYCSKIAIKWMRQMGGPGRRSGTGTVILTTIGPKNCDKTCEAGRFVSSFVADFHSI